MSIANIVALIVCFCTHYGNCKEETCVPTVYFRNCDTTPNRPLTLYNTLATVLEVKIAKKCITSDLHYYWSLRYKDKKEVLHSFPDRKQRRSVMIESYMLHPGDYVLTSHVRESSMFGGDIWIERRCYIKMTSWCPVPGIFGAEHKTAPIGSEITLDTSFSFTCKLAVKYSWQCRSTGNYSQCANLNGQLGPKKTMVIQGQVGDTYWITVRAKADRVPVQTCTQVINVTEARSPILDLKCMKNCQDTGAVFSNPNIPVYIKAFCRSECDQIDRLEWDLQADTNTKFTAEEIKANGTYYGLNRPLFILKPGWIQYDESFELIMNAYNKENRILARNMVHINMTSDVGGRSNCTATHNGVIGVDRKYKIKCIVPNLRRPSMYKLQQWVTDPITNEPLALTLMNSHQPVFEVRLGSYGKSDMQNLTFIVVEDTMIMTNITFQVNVPNPFPTETLDTLHGRMLYEYHGHADRMSVPWLLRVGRIHDAAQIMNVIFCEAARFNISHPGVTQMRLKSQVMFMKTLSETQKPLLPDLEYQLALVPHLMVEKTKHLYHSKLRSRICLRIAKGINRHVKTLKYPLTMQSALELLTIPLHKCANYYLDDDYEKPFLFNVPLPPPIPEHIGLLDDYPNYGESLDEFSIEDLMEIVGNAISTINEISEAYAHTYILGEHRTYINYTANTSIDVNQGIQRNRREFEDGYITLILPDDLGLDAGEDVRIVYTTLPVEAFFWDSTSGKMSNHILELNLYKEGKGGSHTQITKIPKNIDIYFKLNTRQNVVSRTSFIEMPLEDVEWTEEYVTKYMKIVRVEVRENNTLMSTIDEFSTVNSLMLAITKNRKPTRADFTIEIRQTEEQIFLYNRSNIDTWYYVGMLPREQEIKGMATRRRSGLPDYGFRFNDDYTVSMNEYEPPKINISFKFCFTALACKEWSGHAWKIENCDVSPHTGPDQMHCICKEVRTLAADAKLVSVKDETLLDVDYKLETTINLLIPMITAVVVALYCFLISFVYFRKKPMALYFLSDNVEEDRYAYLVIAVTSPYSDSSTTSNIVIKVCGQKTDSKPHVLNYPDPDLRIMQDGREDWFILTSRYHLGDITKIQVWYDGIGPKYTWFADCIKIYDLQTEEHWFFPMGKRFNLTMDNMHSFTFYPANENEWVSKRKLGAYFRYYWNADNVWNITNKKCDHLLLYTERMTIILGQILTTFSIALGLVSLPTFRLKDGLGKNMFDSFNYVFWHSVGIAIVVFLIYCPFSLLFRYTPKSPLNFRKDAVILSNRFYDRLWFTLATMICISVGYLIWFGFWISYITSMLVLAVSVFAILINAILLENLRLVCYKYVNSFHVKHFRRKYTININAIVAEAERQRRFLYNKLGQYALRPYLTHLYHPLSDTDYQKLRAQKKMEHNITKNVKDMAFFYLYTSMLFFLLLIKLNSFTYINSKHVAYMALNGSNQNGPTAYQVRNFEILYDYFNNTLANMLHPMSWYGRWNVSESVLLDDYNTKLLGVVRIRQKRVRPTYCHVKSLSALVNVTVCSHEYSSVHKDTRDSNIGSKSMWAYQRAEKYDNYKSGELFNYDGSGFIMELGRNINNTYYIIQLMKKSNWLDKHTRAVLVEFLTYNANQNLFSAVTVMFERSATMEMIVSHNIITLQLMHAQYYMEVLSIIVFAVFCVLIFKLFLKYMRKVLKYKLAAFFRLANLWEISIIGTNLGIVYLYLKQYNENVHFFDQLRKSKNNAFVPYFALMNGYKMAQTAMAILFAFAITRVLGFMQFIESFRVFQRTMYISYRSYLGVTVLTILTIMTFTYSGHVMFGTYSWTFRTVGVSAISLLKRSASLSKDFSNDILYNYNTQWGYAFFTLFSVWVLVTRNLFIATTILFHRKSRQYLRQSGLEYNLKQYIADRWSFYSEFWKRHLFHLRLKGGKEDLTPPIATPKHHSIRYANCVVMPVLKLRFITLIVTAALRRLLVRRWKDPPTEADFALMRRLTDAYLAEQTEPISEALFFIGKNSRGKATFMSNSKLLEMEYLVNNVVGRKEEKLPLKDTVSLKRLREMESILKTYNRLLGNITIKKTKRRE